MSHLVARYAHVKGNPGKADRDPQLARKGGPIAHQSCEGMYEDIQEYILDSYKSRLGVHKYHQVFPFLSQYPNEGMERPAKFSRQRRRIFPQAYSISKIPDRDEEATTRCP